MFCFHIDYIMHLTNQLRGFSPRANYTNLVQTELKKKIKLHGLSPRANYTDRATAACRRSDCQL
jgi:hypothetical protein